jgi:hypothetical protein
LHRFAAINRPGMQFIVLDDRFFASISGQAEARPIVTAASGL